MPKEQQELTDVSQEIAEDDFQEAILAELTGQTKDILEASKVEHGTVMEDEVIEKLLEEQIKKDAAKPKAKKKSEGSEEAGGVRFNSLEEAERETRKLQSERDSLKAQLEKAGTLNPEVQSAMQMLNDIRSDPKLSQLISTYYETGKFPGETAGRTDDEFAEFDNDYQTGGHGSSTPEQIEQLVNQKVNERLESEKQKAAREAWFAAQKQALKEAYSNFGEDEWNELMQFAQDPRGATLVNLYRLKNINQEIEDRSRILAERMLRSGGRGLKPSVAAMSGATVDELEGDPQAQVLRDIVRMGRRDSLL